MQTFINILFFTFLSFTTLSQSTTKTISGTIKNTKNETVSGATVRLLKAIDSSMIQKTISSESGKIRFNNLQNGSYLLAVTAIGQKEFTSIAFNIDDLHGNILLPVIVLVPAKAVNLKEVLVTAKRPLIEQETDKTIVNVGSMLSSATSNALEVLEKTPGVTVGPTGDVSLNGRGGVLVLIDGRPTYMSGQDLATYLKSLPGSLLEKIELIDNPSARYDAAGNAIINIRLKKNRAGGYTGNISTGYSQGKYGRNNDALNLNYNQKQLNFFASAGYNREKNYTDDFSERRFYNTSAEPMSTVSLASKQKFTSSGLNANFGLDYTFSANTSYGFLVNMNESKRDGLLDYTSNNYNAYRQVDTIGSGKTVGGERRMNIGTNFNFLHKFGKTGKELSADVNYLNYHINGDQSLQNFLYHPNGDLTSSTLFLYDVPSNINIYTVKADYVHPFKTKVKLETGFKSSVVDNNNIFDYYDVIGELQKINYSKSNHFKYHENINAGYISAQKNGKRLGAQLGLRVENTRAIGRQLGNSVVQASSFSKNYTQLFPGAFLSYKLDTLGKNSVSLIITRRINRPNYQLMNPFLFFRDKYSYSAGNPLLSPQYQFRYELRYTYSHLLRMAFSYNRFTNVIFQTTEAVGDIFITRPENVATGYMLLLNTGLSLAPAKWWSLNADILLSHIGLNGMAYTEKLHPSAYIARINLMNQLRFNKGWSGEWGGYYASQDLNGQAFTSGMFRANAGIQKKFWKDKGSIRLGFEDIFHSWIYHNRSVSLKQAQFYQTSESDTQRIALGFTYRFGKEDFARKRRHADDASDEEKGRTQ